MADLAEESIALNTDTEQFHGLNPTAQRMLEALRTTGSVQEAKELLAPQFAVDPAILSADLDRLVETLCERGILERIADA